MPLQTEIKADNCLNPEKAIEALTCGWSLRDSWPPDGNYKDLGLW
jgi:hypothetical protein